MSDDPSTRRPQERSRIDLTEASELKFWTEELHVSKQQLAQAVDAVGNSPDKVRQYLQK